jgi:hypothetical protein
MTSRSYALILIAGAATLFLGLAAVNVILDPWWVLRVSPLRHSSVNDRYDAFRDYVAAPDRYEALLLSSSRGLEFSLDEMSRHTNGEKYARFSVSYGRLADHLGMLEFVLRDNAARGTRLKDLFILIDIDGFGEPAPAPDELQLLQAQAVSGEPAFRFWWRNLTAIQMPAWKRVLQEVGAHRAAMNALAGAAMSAAFAAPAATTATTAPPRPTQAALTTPRVRVSERPYYEDDMRLWARIVVVCRDNHVRLVAALSPLSPENLAAIDPADAEAVAERISRVAPVWDFSGPQEPSNTPDLWWSPRHYHREIAGFMLGRMYGTDVPAEWRNFGHVRGAR